MAQNTSFKPLIDSKTGCRDYSAATLDTAGSPYGHDTGTYPAWVDFGEGALLGDGTRQVPASRAAVALRVTDFVRTSGGMDVRIALSNDGSTIDAEYVIRSYEDATVTAWNDVIPFSTVLQGTAYRYAQVRLSFDAGSEASAGWHVTELPFHG